ncbi:MAG: ribosomal protein L11 methyltransferase, partial [Saprospiraceae bacterium]
MPWLQLTIPTTRAASPRIEKILTDYDALSITYEDNGDEAILEPEIGDHTLWSMVSITGLFDVKVNTKLISNTLNQESKILETEHAWKLLADKDWERESLKNYLPIKCSKRL